MEESQRFSDASFISLYSARIILILSCVFLVLFFVFSIVYFPRQVYGTHVEDLGQYGDFVGGVLGTILSLANLGVTIYLATILHKIEKENVSSAINSQRSIALMQLKHQELALFKTNCDKAIELWSNIGGPVEDFVQCAKLINTAIDRIQSMFPELRNHSFFEFRLFGYASTRAEDYAKEMRDELGRIDYERYTEDLIHSMYNNLGSAKKDYYTLIRKLSDWTFGDKN